MPVSLDLTEDQVELQKWLHEFAADVVRPAGINTIFEGTSEIQRLVIARAISGAHIR